MIPIRWFRPRLIAFVLLILALVGLYWGAMAPISRAVGRFQSVPPAVHLPLVQQQEPTPGIATMIYVVQPGDTLFSIARRFGTTVAVLVELNNLENPSLIRVGQELLVPVVAGTPTPTLTPTPTATTTPTPTTGSVWTDPPVAVELLSPQADGLHHSPIEVIGFSRTFEANVNLRLTASDGTVLAERNALGGSVDGFDFFHSYLRFTVTGPISATLEVFETSAADGTEIHKVSVPLILLPGQRFVDLNSPVVGATVCNPVVVSGYSNTFEATVSLALSARDGTVITQTSAMGGNLGFYADFSASLNHPVTSPQPVLVSAYEDAPSGQGRVDQTLVPISLYPAGSSQCP